MWLKYVWVNPPMRINEKWKRIFQEDFLEITDKVSKSLRMIIEKAEQKGKIKKDL